MCSLIAIAAVVAPLAAHAAKWNNGCPPARIHLTPSLLGAVSSPFAHPGHDISIVLSNDEVAATGGFSTEPNGNNVIIAFASLFGQPVWLPTFAVDAITPATLSFAFPDARMLVGRVLAGPVEIVVATAGVVTAHILPRHLVGLPPGNDVADLVAGGPRSEALATIDARGDLWIPLEFDGIGISDMDMPGCPAKFTHKQSFAVGVDVRANLPRSGPISDTYPPFRRVRRADVFLGDFTLGTPNIYGTRLRSSVPVIRGGRGFALGICAVNDAVSLVLRARGRRRWALPWSGFAQWMPDSQPLAISLDNITSEPAVHHDVQTMRSDAFGTPCLP